MKEQTNITNFDNYMKNRIFGQDHVVDSVSDLLYVGMAGLSDTKKPLAALLFTGPTGVGKTEFAKEMASFLDMELVRLDMSEYADEYSARNLTGGQAGLVGYEEGGILTNAISKNPRCVLLFDEIEKADKAVYNTLLQVLDYGTLTDTKGNKVDFSETIIIFTSNLGATKQRGIGFSESENINRWDAVVDFLTPEFRNRLSKMIEFNKLTPDVATHIVDKYLNDFSKTLLEKNINLTVSSQAKELLNINGFQAAMGARSVDREITNSFKTAISKELVCGALQYGGDVHIDVKNSQFTYSLQSANKPQNISNSEEPNCPICEAKMIKRMAYRGAYAGKYFYGCQHYPRCTGLINIE
jgi:ATP-dependent Clp protease ATP-binding subunit ClpA